MLSQNKVAGWQRAADTFRATGNGFSVEVDPGRSHALVTVFTDSIQAAAQAGSGDSAAGDISAGDFSAGSAAPRFTVQALFPHPLHSFKPEEIYVRQSDLIARYTQSAEDQFAFQLDWRLHPVQPPFSIGLEIWISLQTQLLDSHPSLELRSVGPGVWSSWTDSELNMGEANDHRPSSDCQAALLSTADSTSLLWLIDPSDQQQVHWMGSNSKSELRAQLFGDFLEKGVIRRARLRLLVGAEEVQVDDVKGVYQDLFTSALPLTA